MNLADAFISVFAFFCLNVQLLLSDSKIEYAIIPALLNVALKFELFRFAIKVPLFCGYRTEFSTEIIVNMIHSGVFMNIHMSHRELP